MVNSPMDKRRGGHFGTSPLQVREERRRVHIQNTSRALN